MQRPLLQGRACALTGREHCPLQAMVQNLVRSALSLTFVISAARVVFNVKARMTREATWQLELKGDLTKQRRVEAVDKLMSVLTLLVAAVFGLQAIGLDGERLLALQHPAHVSYHPLLCAYIHVCGVEGPSNAFGLLLPRRILTSGQSRTMEGV